jgi:hypothetical protein
MTPLGIKNVYKGKYLSQKWIPTLEEASGFKHPCHYVPKFRKLANLENRWAQVIQKCDSKNDGI